MSAYYHGGTPGLAPGGYILPRAVTGVRSLRALAMDDDEMAAVCVTTNKRLTVLYAVTHVSARGVVYEVEPEGEIAPNLTTLAADCFVCERARIVRISRVLFPEMQSVREHIRAGRFDPFAFVGGGP